MSKLIFKDGVEVIGQPFGYDKSVAGEVVFVTGMVGYTEAFTDPSFAGQILVLTYPLIGNYGVSDKKYWESDKLQIKGLVVSDYIDTPSHASSVRTLASWLRDEKVPALIVKDTRALAIKIREEGAQLGKIVMSKDITYEDPNKLNLVAEVSRKKVDKIGRGNKKIVLIDCGAKRNISNSLVNRGVQVNIVPWDYDIFADEKLSDLDALVISNGPGDPKMIPETTTIVQKALQNSIPTLGICLGNQILSLAAGGDTKKLKFGHRSQNQPCLLENSGKCFLTTQNHGFAVSQVPKGFKQWFTNANDGTNEGIIHNKHPFMSVQFHPEATPGPVDTDWVFDFFLKHI